MPSFRKLALSAPVPLTSMTILALVTELMQPCHFFLGPSLTVVWRNQFHEEISWEVYKGRLLDSAHTRERRSFVSWSLYRVETGVVAEEPLVSVKWDQAREELHVTRSILCHAWEGYYAGENVILSRETRKWQRELVGTSAIREFSHLHELRDELIGRLFQAVIGTSRLPLTSVEAPLPEFSLGQLAYFYQADSVECDLQKPMTSTTDLLQRGLHAELSFLEKTKLLETFLHAVPFEELHTAAAAFFERWSALGHGEADLLSLLRNVFNETALSPYTDLVDKALAFVEQLERQGVLSAAEVVDYLGYLLRQIGRHLTAYDLVKFHHRGANYPDALLLDVVLKRLLRRIDDDMGMFFTDSEDEESARNRKRIRRRALRQGWLLRAGYEGHLVPNVPTSPGENNRVLPAPFERIAEEQILDPSKRDKRLYEGDPLSRHWSDPVKRLLTVSVHDLEHPAELRELGLALFLDRPLSAGKIPGEADASPLFSYEAFSARIAGQRLHQLEGLVEATDTTRSILSHCLERLKSGQAFIGLNRYQIGGSSRPGGVSLQDAFQASADFVILRSTRRSINTLFELFDWEPLRERLEFAWLTPESRLLIVQSSKPGHLAIYDEQVRQPLEVVVDLSLGTRTRGGVELPGAGLSVVVNGEVIAIGPK